MSRTSTSTRPSSQNDSKYKSMISDMELLEVIVINAGINGLFRSYKQPQVNPEDANKRADIVAGQRALERRITKQKIALTDAYSDSKTKMKNWQKHEGLHQKE